MRICDTSGCDRPAKHGGFCPACLSREYPMLEEMTMKALRLASVETDSSKANSSP